MIKKIMLVSSLIILIISIIIIFYNDNKVVKIGIIDSSIPNNTEKIYNIKKINHILQMDRVSNDISHGLITLEIISREVKNPEFYYVEVLSDDLTGDISNVVEGIQWCIDNDVDIICMSFATLKEDNTLKDIIEETIKNKIKVVAATINYSEMDCYPAMYNGVISVSVGFNDNATIIFENKPLEVFIDGQKFYLRGTSVYTAYVCGQIASK